MKKSKSTRMGPLKNLISSCCAVGIALLLMTAPPAEGKSNEDHPEFELPSFEVDSIDMGLTLPTFTNAEMPNVTKSMVGTEVTMTFQISKLGYVNYIRSNASRFSEEEASLASVMSNYLRTWRFNPALDKDGNAVGIRVKLPVKVISGKRGSVSEYAKLDMKKLVIVELAQR